MKSLDSSFIQVFEDALPLESVEKCSFLCDAAAELATVGRDNSCVKEIRNVQIHNRDELYVEHLDAINLISSHFWEKTSEYLDKLKLSKLYEYEDYGEYYKLEMLNFLKYSPGCFYKSHSDETLIGTVSPGFARQISYVLFVNDSYSGGCLSFPFMDKKIEPRVNRLVMFPSNWLFVHEVLPVLNGVRKSVVTWGGSIV